MNRLEALRLSEAWQQCQRHLHHLRHALSGVQETLPLTAGQLQRFAPLALSASPAT